MPVEGWEAVPLAAPLSKAEEAKQIKRCWIPVRVPGHWQLEDALAGYQGRVLYRCRFESSLPDTDDAAAFLRFGGVYYSARVWLNSVYLGDHEGYFAPFEFDCTSLLTAGANELLVEVDSPEELDENDRKTVGGVWACWDGMSPYINPGGIFREVALIYGTEVRVHSVGVQADPTGRGQIILDLYARREAQVGFVGSVRPLGFDAPGTEIAESVRVASGSSRLKIDFLLPRPHLWWTWDRGEQRQYSLVLHGAGQTMQTCFGVRSVELRGWNVYLNGERIFPRGVNYLPTDAYPARASAERLRADAELVREANCNAVRVHAHIAGKAFYAACDELGLLVFQDFPLQWTHRQRVLEPAVEQAGEMARELRSHPSVGIYLAHDEPFYVAPPERWSATGLLRTVVESLAPRWALWQRRVLDPAVVQAIVAEDPMRPVIEAPGHPRETNHLYFGWYYGRVRDLDFVTRLLPGFIRLPTEYGAQALPNPESLQEIWPEGQSPHWDVLSKNYRFQVVRMRHYVPWRGDRNAYIRETQAYQARVLKHATELFRRRKYQPTGGAFAFMLNDVAPTVSWSVVDWRRRQKAGYQVLREAMSPVLICSEYPEESYRRGRTLVLSVFVVNDLPRALGPTRWTWELAVEGSAQSQGHGEVEAPADSAVEVGEIRAELSRPGRATLRLRLHTREITASNQYEFLVRDGLALRQEP